ncbi:MAG: hypothetical protein HY694_08975 [Deltaproteobacteria bacterium]|nr:hypothetical protein [Deltaproteobacteria bacterium]
MHKRNRKWFNLIFASLLIALLSGYGSDHAIAYEGFGATTPGGLGRKVVRVTNLNDSGPGSFREAVSRGGRTVVFDVTGEIALKSHVFVKGSFMTVDGSTAPPPGIILRNRGLIIRGSKGAHDVIIQGIRVRDSTGDCIQIAERAFNVVIDRVSTYGCGDGNIDITTRAHDITVSWSILVGGAIHKLMLIKYNASRISLHHNLYVRGSRNPQVSLEGSGPATDTTVDMRNNVVWDWGFSYGTLVRYGPWANVINNYYENPGGDAIDKLQAIIVCRGDGVETPSSFLWCDQGVAAAAARAYASGNVSRNGADLTMVGTELVPFVAPPVETQDACTGANLVLEHAGVRPADLIDQGHLSAISLPPC